MAKVVLVHHAGVGPLVRMDNVRNPELRVHGLPKGSSVRFTIYEESGATHLLVVSTNGEHPCIKGAWIQAEYNGSSPHRTICSVANRRVA